MESDIIGCYELFLCGTRWSQAPGIAMNALEDRYKHEELVGLRENAPFESTGTPHARKFSKLPKQTS